MHMRFALALLASLVFAPFAMPSVALADAGQAAATAVPETPPPATMACTRPADGKFDTAQVATDCCKGHKGVCGCRAGKIICCDGTVSTQPGCTCHGDDGFLQ